MATTAARGWTRPDCHRQLGRKNRCAVRSKRRALTLIFLLCAVLSCKGEMPRPTPPTASHETPAPAEALVPPAPVALGTHGVVHASSIAMIAVADTGDAALTGDQLGELRLWPALDGSREPIPISAPAPVTHIAIASGTELVVALADEPGDIALLRIGRDGSVHGTAQVVSDLGVEQLAFVGSDLLVRRRDETIERYAANGAHIGRVAAAAGERLGAMATRGRVAIVAIGRGDAPPAQVRRLALEHGFVWGASIKLPEPIARGPLAISPDGHRVAAKRPAGPRTTAQLVVFDLGPSVRPVELYQSVVLWPDTRLGFVDADNLALAHDGNIWWWTLTSSTMLASVVPGATSSVPNAIGNGVVLTAFGSGLALTDPSHTRYLGWKQLAQGALQPIGASLALALCTSCQSLQSTYLWFGDDLVATAHLTLTLRDGMDAYYGPVAIGEHELAVLAHDANGWQTWLGDADDPQTHIDLATPPLARADLRYNDATRELAIIGHSTSTVYRYRIKLEPLAASPLPSVSLPKQYIDVRLVDPERMHGAVAMAVLGGAGTDQTQFQLLYEHPRKAPDIRKVDGYIMAVDPTGTAFAITPKGSIVGYHDGRVVIALSSAERPQFIAPSSDGELVALVSPHTVELFDRGASRWQRRVWAPNGATMSTDGRRLFVETRGGLLAFDTRDGAIVARACGLDFGLHDEPLTTGTLDAPPVCGD